MPDLEKNANGSVWFKDKSGVEGKGTYMSNLSFDKDALKRKLQEAAAALKTTVEEITFKLNNGEKVIW